MAEKKKKVKSMEELTANFDEFMKGKEINPEGKKDFKKLLKKTLTKKSK